MLTGELLKVSPSVPLSNEFPKAENNPTNWQILSHQVCALYIHRKIKDIMPALLWKMNC